MKANKWPSKLIAAMTVIAVVSSAIWLYTTAAHSNQSHARKVLYYQDSMHPWIKSDQPGKCTVCLMDLTPIYEGEGGFGSSGNMVVLSSNTITVMNVQTEEVKRRSLVRTLRIAGNLEADSTRKTIIAAPAPGRIDDVRVASAGVDVTKGQVLATFYSPDLTFQTRRYIFRDRLTEKGQQNSSMPAAGAGSSRHTPNPGSATKDHPLAAQERVEADPYFNDLLSTQNGTVVERNVFDGQYVAEGDRLFTIVDCSVLWFRFDVYEHQLAWIEPGQQLEVTVPSIPGKSFPAVISVIEPTLNETTRTVKVRADVTNPLVGSPGRQRRLLHLGMYADGRLRAETSEALAVSRTAILFPGGQAYAYVEKGGGAYEMRRVDVGAQGDDHWEILRGLEEGERVVTTGNVLIDAQAQFSRTTAPGESGAEAMTAAVPTTIHAHDGEGSTGHASNELIESQNQAVAGFLAVADGISAALAADNLGQLKPRLEQLPAVAQALAREFPADHAWHALAQSIVASSKWPVPADLDAARKAFLPFSTNTVAWVQRLRAEVSGFRSSKVYFCPMAPKPGLWYQAKGPLRNPYYGAKMLSCGEEVAAPPSSRLVSGKPIKPAALPLRPASEPPATAVSAALTAEEPAAESTPPRSATARGTGAYAGAAAALRSRLAGVPSNSTNASATQPAGKQPTALSAFLTVADGISQALASDDVGQLNQHIARLPAVLPPLQHDYPASHGWNGPIQRLAALPKWPPEKNLDEARKRFLAFSTNVVDLVKQVRRDDATLAGLKIYFCPMAPKPGVWFQAKGPLRNPFYGAKMLSCGEEVAP